METTSNYLPPKARTASRLLLVDIVEPEYVHVGLNWRNPAPGRMVTLNMWVRKKAVYAAESVKRKLDFGPETPELERRVRVFPMDSAQLRREGWGIL